MQEETGVPKAPANGGGSGNVGGGRGGQGNGQPECAGVSKNELCEEFKRWGTEISEWLDKLWQDQYPGDPGDVDPPPPPPWMNS